MSHTHHRHHFHNGDLEIERSTRIRVQPLEFPVSLAKAKDWASRGDNTKDDDVISDLVASVTQEALHGLDRLVLMGATYEDSFSQFPFSEDFIELNKTPLLRVNSVKYIDTDGNEQTLPTVDFRVDKNYILGRIEAVDGFPGTDTRANAVTVNYDAGFTDGVKTTVPATDIFTITAHGFTNGDSKRLMTVDGTLPAGLSLNKNYFIITATTDTFQLSLTSGGGAVDVSDTGTDDWYVGEIPMNLLAAIKHRVRGSLDNPYDFNIRLKNPSRFDDMIDAFKVETAT